MTQYDAFDWSEERVYYGVRTGAESPIIEIDFDEMKGFLFSTYERFKDQGYFAQGFGQECVDAGTTIGTMGSDIGAFFFLKLRKRDLWPIENSWVRYSLTEVDPKIRTGG